MKNILIVLSLGLVFVRCSRSIDHSSLNRINENELIINDGAAKYLGELYSGLAVELHDDDSISSKLLTRNIARQYTYRNGVLSGEHKEWHVNGALKKIGMYVEGKREGKWMEYFKNGELLEVKEDNEGILIKELSL